MAQTSHEPKQRCFKLFHPFPAGPYSAFPKVPIQQSASAGARSPGAPLGGSRLLLASPKKNSLEVSVSEKSCRRADFGWCRIRPSVLLSQLGVLDCAYAAPRGSGGSCMVQAADIYLRMCLFYLFSVQNTAKKKNKIK